MSLPPLGYAICPTLDPIEVKHPPAWVKKLGPLPPPDPVVPLPPPVMVPPVLIPEPVVVPPVGVGRRVPPPPPPPVTRAILV